MQDWGITYDELEPFYDKFEYVCGVVGQGRQHQGAHAARRQPVRRASQPRVPTPPLTPTYDAFLLGQVAQSLGYHPFPRPSSTLSEPFTNPDGQTIGGCIYCGFCERFGCEMGAKASPHMTVIPAALGSGRFDLRTRANVLRVNLDSTRTRAVSVMYLDLQTGREMEQPADAICLTSYVLNNVRLMLLSGIGRPYAATTGQGVVGRSYAYQVAASAVLFFEDKVFNPFIGTGAVGTVVDDYNGDNFDHAGLGFIGGGSISAGTTGARPIASHPAPPGTPRWGSAWKKTVGRYYARNMMIAAQIGDLAYRGNCLDLDPQYQDAYGLPLLRITYDRGPNERRASTYLRDVCERLARGLNPSLVATSDASEHRYSIVPYQSTHNTGGAAMGKDAATSAVNRYLQSWDVPNVFVVGASAFPQNAGYNPTGTVGALAYWAADAIATRYVKKPGLLA